MSKPTLYYPHIDGLRAIAVLAVIIYHINFTWLPGGFVGVDIFFVISGYLITSIIVRKSEKNTFSLMDFYFRRVKRILPVYFVMVLVALVVGYFLLLPLDFKYFSASAFSTILFASNIYFARANDYFSPGAHELPLLHTWSLGVEEQFYIFWPVLVIAFVKYKANQKVKIFFLALVGVLFFVLAENLSQSAVFSKWSFFILVTRVGEFITGAIIVFYHPNEKYNNLYAVLGVVLLGVSFFALDKNSIFPGYNAIAPCLASVFLILSVDKNRNANIAARILESKLLVAIGVLSYSLYLWHWPILSFIRYYIQQDTLSYEWIMFSVFLMFTLSWFSYRYIENPARLKVINFKQGIIFYYFIPASIIACVFLVSRYGHFLDRIDDDLMTSYHGGLLVCHNDFSGNCDKGALNVAPRVLLIGDSHAAHLNHLINDYGKDKGWSATVLSASACPPFNGFDLNRFFQSDYKKACGNLIDKINLIESKYENIFISLRWDIHLGLTNQGDYRMDDDFIDTLEKEIVDYLERGKNIFLIGQVTKYKKSVLRSSLVNTKVKNDRDMVFEQANKIIASLSNKYNKVYYINLAEITNKWENGRRNGLPMYVDGHHLNSYGAKAIAKELISEGALKWADEIILR